MSLGTCGESLRAVVFPLSRLPAFLHEIEVKRSCAELGQPGHPTHSEATVCTCNTAKVSFESHRVIEHHTCVHPDHPLSHLSVILSLSYIIALQRCTLRTGGADPCRLRRRIPCSFLCADRDSWCRKSDPRNNRCHNRWYQPLPSVTGNPLNEIVKHQVHKWFRVTKNWHRKHLYRPNTKGIEWFPVWDLRYLSLSFVMSVLVFKPSTSRQSLGISLTKVFDSLSREGPDVDNEITSPTLPAWNTLWISLVSLSPASFSCPILVRHYNFSKQFGKPQLVPRIPLGSGCSKSCRAMQVKSLGLIS